MVLAPRKQKYRKFQKGRVSAKSKGGTKLAFGDYGLKSLDIYRIEAKQIEAARRTAVRHMRREGKFWIKIFPDIPVSKKPIEVRMGKGKGNPEFFVARVSKGRILFEISGVPHDIAIRALELAQAKLPIKTKIIQRYE